MREPCMYVCAYCLWDGKGPRGEEKSNPPRALYVTVRITDVPTDTQCGLWAEACGEPVWLQLACFWTLCAYYNM